MAQVATQGAQLVVGQRGDQFLALLGALDAGERVERGCVRWRSARRRSGGRRAAGFERCRALLPPRACRSSRWSSWYSPTVARHGGCTRSGSCAGRRCRCRWRRALGLGTINASSTMAVAMDTLEWSTKTPGIACPLDTLEGIRGIFLMSFVIRIRLWDAAHSRIGGSSMDRSPTS